MNLYHYNRSVSSSCRILRVVIKILSLALVSCKKFTKQSCVKEVFNEIKKDDTFYESRVFYGTWQSRLPLVSKNGFSKSVDTKMNRTKRYP